jgi:hypothetical protein
MKLNVAALAIAGALLWGASIFLVGLANLAVPGYGAPFLAVVAGLYPGYHVGAGFGSILIGTAYATVDGAIGGAILGWLYNVVAVSARESAGRGAGIDPTDHRFGHHAR